MTATREQVLMLLGAHRDGWMHDFFIAGHAVAVAVAVAVGELTGVAVAVAVAVPPVPPFA